MKTDIEIAQSALLQPIETLADTLGISSQHLETYGKYKAKISDQVYKIREHHPDGKLILVTAINPTPAGEGKTTITVGLGQAMKQIGKKAIVTLREPSLGPVFGLKGGAAGGGYAQLVPMEDINLHFTGDMHAITAANNLLSAMIDNHLQQGNALQIDPRRIVFKRCMDMNDRALRHINIGLGGKAHGIPREDSFQITVASEVMAILCLASDLQDLKQRFGKILVAYTYSGHPVFAKQLQVHGAMAALMKQAIQPNLVQTLENTPAILHGGPFANIAHGCNSIKATKLALKLGDYVITEAGFGADLGAEKFFHIKCPSANLSPNGVVIVATIRALKYHGGLLLSKLHEQHLDALLNGFENLKIHVENMKKFNVPIIIAINRFATDTPSELDALCNACESLSCHVTVTEMFEHGGAGGIELAQQVVEICEQSTSYQPLYSPQASITEKIQTIAQKIYRAEGVMYTKVAKQAIRQIEQLGFSDLPICMAKTPYSLSDDPSKQGVPTDFHLTIHQLELSAGAGFIVAYAGNIMTMPGLPKSPAAQQIDINANDEIIGLF